MKKKSISKHSKEEEAAMGPIKETIEKIILSRKKKLPYVQAKVKFLELLDSEVFSLEKILDEFICQENIPEPLKEQVKAFKSSSLRSLIAESIVALKLVEKRFDRSTINIGVAGKAGAGKSTLLQTLAGLSEEQIPTGRGLPVTAVRSRIFHSTQKKAIVRFHTEFSFCEEVLQPFYKNIGLLSYPESISAFADWKFPTTSELNQNETDARKTTLLDRLIRMQKALPSYRQDLGRSETVFPLSELKPLVSYPSEQEEDLPNCSRRYLGVKDVRIECPFPESQVENLGVLDLPGMGEIVPADTMRHAMTFQTEVDLVLLVVRPVGDRNYWDAWNSETLALIDEARKPIHRRGDFAILVVNTGGAHSDDTKTLLGDIKRRVNENIDSKHYSILIADVKDHESLKNNVTQPVLQHLMNSLGKMDSDYLASSANYIQSFLKKCNTEIEALKMAIKKFAPQIQSNAVQIRKDAIKIHEKLAVEFGRLVNEYHDIVDSDPEEKFEKAVNDAYDKVETWIHNGLGRGKEDWLQHAFEAMMRSKTSAPFTAEEFNRIRVFISQSYWDLDLFLSNQVAELWEKVSVAIKNHTKGLIPETVKPGKDFLFKFIEVCENASEPCNSFQKAIQDLLALDIQYRTHFHPRVRKSLEALYVQVVDPQSGQAKIQLTVPVTESGAEQLLQMLEDISIQVNSETRKALESEGHLPNWVLYAALEQFDDALIRAEDSEDDFFRIAISYKDSIWPDKYAQLDSHNAKVGILKRSIEKLESDLQGLKTTMEGNDE